MRIPIALLLLVALVAVVGTPTVALGADALEIGASKQLFIGPWAEDGRDDYGQPQRQWSIIGRDEGIAACRPVDGVTLRPLLHKVEHHPFAVVKLVGEDQAGEAQPDGQATEVQ